MVWHKWRIEFEIFNFVQFIRIMIDVENDEKSKQSSRVKVAIRVRPFIQREIAMQ